MTRWNKREYITIAARDKAKAENAALLAGLEVGNGIWSEDRGFVPKAGRDDAKDTVLEASIPMTTTQRTEFFRQLRIAGVDAAPEFERRKMDHTKPEEVHTRRADYRTRKNLKDRVPPGRAIAAGPRR